MSYVLVLPVQRIDFPRKTSKAAVSASALSLRNNSRSNLWALLFAALVTDLVQPPWLIWQVEVK